MRRIFNFDNLSESKVVEKTNRAEHYTNSISACGCFFYRRRSTGIEALLISYADPGWPRLDDLGGQIDLTDSSLAHAMAREVSEESNGLIVGKLNGDHVMFDAAKEYKVYYTPQSKYYCLAVEVDDDFFPDTSVFGDFETTDKIYRKIEWYNLSNVSDKLAHRIKPISDIISSHPCVEK